MGRDDPGAPNHVSAHCFLLRERTGETFSKPISFSLPEKETVFEIQRKRGSRGGQVAPNRDPAARLYAPVEVRPRPRWTTWVEQGQAGGPIPHFFAACAGGGRGVAPLTDIPSIVESGSPGAPPYEAPSSGGGADDNKGRTV